MVKSFEKDFTQGNLIKQILLYSLPIIGVNLLQGLFSSADILVLSWFAGEYAKGAVGTTTAIINLFIGFFIGISLGASVCVGRCVGKKDKDEAERFVGTSMLFSVVAGVVIAIVGVFMARTMLQWTDCPIELIDDATKYLQIYFLGMPIILTYDYVAAILRAVGDTKNPLIFLAISGVINIGLNTFFIVVLGMDVDGVAIATVVSEAVSLVLSVRLLFKTDGYAHLNLKKFKFFKKELGTLLYIGVPSGLQKVFYAFSNTVISTAINSLGPTVVTGNTVGTEVEKIIHESTEGFAISALSFVSQNHGAKNYKRITQSVLICCGYIAIVGSVLATVAVLFGIDICKIINLSRNAEVLAITQIKLNIISFTYIINGVMNTFSYALRGLGKSIIGMITGLTSGCVLRIAYIEAIKVIFNPLTIDKIYFAYLFCWAIGMCLNIIFYIIVVKMLKKKDRIALQNKELKE